LFIGFHVFEYLAVLHLAIDQANLGFTCNGNMLAIIIKIFIITATATIIIIIIIMKSLINNG